MPQIIQRKKGKRVIDFGMEDDVEPSVELIATTENKSQAKAQSDRSIFEEFDCPYDLEDGLCILRSIGHGKYEIVNLRSVSLDTMGSEEMGAHIRSDTHRLEVFESVAKNCAASMSLIRQAANSATYNIFRFQKLPIELRYRVYEFAVMTPYRLRPNLGGTKTLALPLRATNHQIHDESEKFFWSNNFLIDEIPKDKPQALLQIYDSCFPNFRQVSFDWWSFARKHTYLIDLISRLPHLRTLNLGITAACVTSDHFSYARPQHMHQDNESVKKFRRSNNFDMIASMRGLENVMVSRATKYPPTVASLSDLELEAFQQFLNRELTRPKCVPKAPVIPVPKSMKRGASKQKKRKQGGNSSDDEYLG